MLNNDDPISHHHHQDIARTAFGIWFVVFAFCGVLVFESPDVDGRDSDWLVCGWARGACCGLARFPADGALVLETPMESGLDSEA